VPPRVPADSKRRSLTGGDPSGLEFGCGQDNEAIYSLLRSLASGVDVSRVSGMVNRARQIECFGRGGQQRRIFRDELDL
jgi:hypothetical protein